jgi:hypothetical protein
MLGEVYDKLCEYIVLCEGYDSIRTNMINKFTNEFSTYTSKTYYDLAEKIFQTANEQFPACYWFVAVYDNVQGYENHGAAGVDDKLFTGISTQAGTVNIYMKFRGINEPVHYRPFSSEITFNYLWDRDWPWPNETKTLKGPAENHFTVPGWTYYEHNDDFVPYHIDANIIYEHLDHKLGGRDSFLAFRSKNMSYAYRANGFGNKLMYHNGSEWVIFILGSEDLANHPAKSIKIRHKATGKILSVNGAFPSAPSDELVHTWTNKNKDNQMWECVDQLGFSVTLPTANKIVKFVNRQHNKALTITTAGKLTIDVSLPTSASQWFKLIPVGSSSKQFIIQNVPINFWPLPEKPKLFLKSREQFGEGYKVEMSEEGDSIWEFDY